jgi:hypothetical protein
MEKDVSGKWLNWRVCQVYMHTDLTSGLADDGER